MWEKSRMRFKSVDLIEIGVGPNGSKMNDLIEAVPQAGCLCIEEDETHRAHLCLEAARQAISHRRGAYPKFAG